MIRQVVGRAGVGRAGVGVITVVLGAVLGTVLGAGCATTRSDQPTVAAASNSEATATTKNPTASSQHGASPSAVSVPAPGAPGATTTPAAGAAPPDGTTDTTVAAGTTRTETPPPGVATTVTTTVTTTAGAAAGGATVPAASGTGRTVTVADLASFVPGEKVAGSHADPPQVSIQLVADQRTRRAAHDLDDQSILVDGATKNGWIAVIDTSPGNPSPLDRRAGVTLELFQSPEGAAAYAALEAPYWNPRPSQLDRIDTPEIPGSISYRVADSGRPLTQINVARGPVYVKVAVYETNSFTSAGLTAAKDLAGDVLARIDKICGATCTGDPASAVATPSPPTFTVKAGACVDTVAFDPAHLSMPTSALTEVPCAGPHEAEVLGRYKSDITTTYPASSSALADQMDPADAACDAGLAAVRSKVNDAAGGGTSIFTTVLPPTPAEVDGGISDGLCLVYPVGDHFVGKYLPALNSDLRNVSRELTGSRPQFGRRAAAIA